MTTAYIRAKAYSEDRLTTLRTAISRIVPADVSVITSGSYARREASAQSDIDYFSVFPGSKPNQETVAPIWLKPLDDAINKVVPKAPSEDGAFKEFEYRDNILQNIGGN